MTEAERIYGIYKEPNELARLLMSAGLLSSARSAGSQLAICIFNDLNSAMDKMPFGQRYAEAIIYYFFKGMTTEEIGDELGISYQAVHKKIGRAIVCLSDELSGRAFPSTQQNPKLMKHETEGEKKGKRKSGVKIKIKAKEFIEDESIQWLEANDPLYEMRGKLEYPYYTDRQVYRNQQGKEVDVAVLDKKLLELLGVSEKE